jgi:hypothetical protein
MLIEERQQVSIYNRRHPVAVDRAEHAEHLEQGRSVVEVRVVTVF